jgi:crossover junction endodeoxyribonuclease RusA
VTIILPLPPKELHPNSRPHWAMKARRTKKYRADCGYAALDAMNKEGLERPRWKQAKGIVRFFFRTRARRDADNCMAALKAAADGIADAGLIVNDSGLRLIAAEDWNGLDKGNPRAEIELEEVTSA